MADSKLTGKALLAERKRLKAGENVASQAGKVQTAIIEGEAKRGLKVTSSTTTPKKVAVTPVNVAGLKAPSKAATGTTATDRQTFSTFKSRGEEVNLTKVKETAYARGEAEANKRGKFAEEGEVYDPNAALKDRAVRRDLGEKPGAVSPFISQGRAEAINKKFASEIGEQPVNPAMGEGWGEMTKEQQLEATADYQANLADWYKKLGEKSAQELGDVSVQVADLAHQIQNNQAGLDTLMGTLNTVNPQYGSALQNVLNSMKGSSVGNITPESLAQVEALSNEGLSADEFQLRVRTLLSSGVSNEKLNAFGLTKTDGGYTNERGLTFPINSSGIPILDPLDLPDDITGMELAAMELMFGERMADAGLLNELDVLKDYATSVLRHTATSKEEILTLFGDDMAVLNEEKINALADIKFKEAQLSLQKDKSLNNILAQEAAQEGFMRGQLEAWGAEESTAALAVMGNIKTKFLSQYADTEEGYNVDLARLSDLELRARQSFVTSMLSLSNKKNIAVDKLQNNYFDSLDKIKTGTSSAYRNRDIKKMGVYQDYFSNVRSIQAEAAAVAREQAKSTRDFNLELMKTYANQQGYAYELDDKGNVILARDANGSPVKTVARLNAEKSGGSSDFFFGGGRGQTVFNEPIEPTGRTSVLGSEILLKPTVNNALGSAEQSLGSPILIADHTRSTETQAAAFASGKPGVAAPGTSFHEVGQAFDLSQRGEDNMNRPEVFQSLRDAGFQQHPNEWWHWSMGEFGGGTGGTPVHPNPKIQANIEALSDGTIEKYTDISSSKNERLETKRFMRENNMFIQQDLIDGETKIDQELFPSRGSTNTKNRMIALMGEYRDSLSDTIPSRPFPNLPTSFIGRAVEDKVQETQESVDKLAEIKEVLRGLSYEARVALDNDPALFDDIIDRWIDDDEQFNKSIETFKS